MKRALIIIVLIGVIGAAGFFIYSNYRQAQAANQNSFQTVTLANGDLTAMVGATGTVRANQSTTVNWQTSGRIGKVNVKVGDQVTVNQVLAELDSTTLSQNIILARSDLVTAQRNLDNLKDSTLARSQAEQSPGRRPKGPGRRQNRPLSQEPGTGLPGNHRFCQSGSDHRPGRPEKSPGELR